MAKKDETILIQDGDQVIELTGANKETFIVDREQMVEAKALLQAEYKAKQNARDSAIKKLGEIAGLTEEEIEAII
jgi:hypothetical protein